MVEGARWAEERTQQYQDRLKAHGHALGGSGGGNNLINRAGASHGHGQGQGQGKETSNRSGPWRREGKFKFTFEAKSVDRRVTFKSMDASDHSFSDVGQSKYASRRSVRSQAKPLSDNSFSM